MYVGSVAVFFFDTGAAGARACASQTNKDAGKLCMKVCERPYDGVATLCIEKRARSVPVQGSTSYHGR